MDAAAGCGARPPSPAPVHAGSSPGSTLETQLDSLLETFKRGAARAMMEQPTAASTSPQHDATDTADVPGRLLRFRLPSARRLPFNLSLKRSRSGVSALSSAEESPPSESASSSSSGASPCPLASARGGGSSAPHRRSLPGLLEASSGGPPTPTITPTHHANNNCSSSTADNLAITAGATIMDEESRVKEASAILHSMMTKGGRIKMPSHMQEESVHHSGERENSPNMSGPDSESKQKQYVVLTNMQEPPQQSNNDHISQMKYEMREHENAGDAQSATQIFVTPDIEEVMSENEEVEREVNTEGKPEIRTMPRKKRKISDYLASGIDPTKLEESVAQVLHRFSLGCECIESNCFTNLNSDLVYRHRLNIAELTKAEQDMYLMGVTMASLTNPDETCRRKERQRLRAQYVFQGKKVCLDAFLYLENCTHYQLKRIRKHVMTHGVTPRIHGNHGKKPHNTFSLDIYKHAITYLENYILPYIPPTPAIKTNKLKNKKVIINLPPKITRKNIHNDYRDFCLNLDPPIKVMGYSSFRHFISEQFPNLRFSKPEKAVVPKFGPDAEAAATRGQFDDSDTERPESSGGQPTTIPLVMTSANPDPTPSTFSSGGNTYVITQVLPAGFVPVNLSSCQMQGFQSMPDQATSSNIVMAPTSTMSVPQSTTHNAHPTYTFSNV